MRGRYLYQLVHQKVVLNLDLSDPPVVEACIDLCFLPKVSEHPFDHLVCFLEFSFSFGGGGVLHRNCPFFSPCLILILLTFIG